MCVCVCVSVLVYVLDEALDAARSSWVLFLIFCVSSAQPAAAAAALKHVFVIQSSPSESGDLQNTEPGARGAGGGGGIASAPMSSQVF